ncbi:hypothetical protein [Lacrimispora amygdalina]|uniref:hypothetical protein n=1 Tax=Lacrimispora amygdalina TaxID=253257 RepID=UPI000BE3F39C|nr:hypothetical protein [Lacrimispora amygdalina]
MANNDTVGVSLFYQNDWVMNTLKDYGFTPGKVSIHINGGKSVWRIDGKEYPMNENGYFKIPLDVMCEPGSMEIVDAQGNPVVLHDPDA